MNKIEANRIRESIGLPPLPVSERNIEKERRRKANLARRAQESRDLKARRAKR